MDQIPSEAIANVFEYIPTLALGRMMVVCKGFNQVLSTNPSLWRVVDLKRTAKGNAFKIIEIFAARSRNTLEVITVRERLKTEEESKLLDLLGDNKASLRRIDIPYNDPPNSVQAGPMIRFFNDFKKLEWLNYYCGVDLQDPTGGLPGVLTVFGWGDVCNSQPWSSDDLARISSLRTLFIEEDENDRDPGPSLQKVLQSCSSTLTQLTVKARCDNIGIIQTDLPVLSDLVLGRWSGCGDFFCRPIQSLKHLEVYSRAFNSLWTADIFPNVQVLTYVVDWPDWDQTYDVESQINEDLIEMSGSFDHSLRCIKLKTADQDACSVDPWIKSMNANCILPATAPLLSDLYVSSEQKINPILLAEMVLSRNLASRLELEDGERRLCSELHLQLSSSLVAKFKAAEQRVLSRCLRSVVRFAGGVRVSEWDGK